MNQPAIATLTVAFILLLAPFAQADAVQATPAAQAYEVHWTVTTSESDLQFGTQQGFDTVRFANCGYIATPGTPRLPVHIVRVALPAGMSVTDAYMVRADTQPLTGTYNLFPAQPAQPTSAPAVAMTPPNAELYAQTTPYPADQVELVHQADLAGQSFALLRVCPLSYTPADGTLTLCTDVEIVLSGVGGYVCGDYLSPSASDNTRDEYLAQLAGLVANPAEISLTLDPEPAPLTRGVTADDYDYVIITQPSWVDDFQPLADWRTQIGFRAAIVTTDWIYNSGGYSGSEPEKIRTFIVDAHDNWGASSFLLGGDTNVVPPHVDTFTEVAPEPIPNDTYYADYDEDWIAELHVGRAAVRSEAAIATFISKIMTYEKNPPSNNYATSAAFFGFDLNTLGSGEGENCKTDIKSLYLPTGWTFGSEYDSESGTHKSDVISYLNTGYNLINHIDHCGTTAMGTGGTNHGDYLGNSNMTALTNGDRQSILYTIGCWACDFDATTCIAEAFVQNTNGGGVAFIGNSRYGYYYPFGDDGVSLSFDRNFFKSLFNSNLYFLGSCFSNHKNISNIGGQTYCYIFTELTLLGDPVMPIWTEEPEILVVNHPASLVAGQSNQFAVQVTDSTGGIIFRAQVCLLKDGDVYEVQKTLFSDTVIFNVSPATAGNMQVTVTAHNFLPYESSVDVVEPEMHTLEVTVQGNGDVTLDPSGGLYAAGTPITLLAVPDNGWMLDYWDGALTGDDNPEQLVVNSTLSVTAVFAEDCNGNSVRDDIDLSTGTSTDVNGSGVPDECEHLGDTNCDGSTDVFDIDSFVMAIISQGEYSIAYPACELDNADCNGDGEPDVFDIDSFIVLIAGS
ncbi:MAG: hypothetical protein JXO22_11695 [Phycisphaerae bacterium]|nr:hypothetical protein [Phycisphaerae bacterium]